MVSGVRVSMILVPFVELLFAVGNPLELAVETLLVLLQLEAFAHDFLVNGRGLEMDLGLRIKETAGIRGYKQEVMQKTLGTGRSGYGRLFSALSISKSVIEFV